MSRTPRRPRSNSRASRLSSSRRIETDSGHYGIGEGYGSPAVGVKEQILSLKDWLVGKDPLEIQKHSKHLMGSYLGFASSSTPGSSRP